LTLRRRALKIRERKKEANPVKEVSYGLSEIAALTYGWLPRPVRRSLLPATLPAFALARRL